MTVNYRQRAGVTKHWIALHAGVMCVILLETSAEWRLQCEGKTLLHCTHLGRVLVLSASSADSISRAFKPTRSLFVAKSTASVRSFCFANCSRSALVRMRASAEARISAFRLARRDSVRDRSQEL